MQCHVFFLNVETFEFFKADSTLVTFPFVLYAYVSSQFVVVFECAVAQWTHVTSILYSAFYKLKK